MPDTELETYLRLSDLIGKKKNQAEPSKADRIVPFSRPTLWRKVKEGTFPAPVKLSAGITAWRLRDIQEWQRAQCPELTK